MTQPAKGPVPVEPDAGRPDTHRPLYDELYAPTAVQGASGGRSVEADSRLWPWLVFQALAGVIVGIAWWVLAPGGLNLLSGNPTLTDGTRTEAWLPRDLVLAGLFLLAGCFVAVLLDGKHSEPGGTKRLILAVAGGAAGAVIAWFVGVQAGHVWGPAVDSSANPSIQFSLRSLSVLFLWPGAMAVATFFLNLVSLLRRPESGK